MNNFLIRLFDILFAAVGIVVLFPLFVIIAVFIRVESKGAVLFRQIRVGKDNKDFVLYKFRTMKSDSSSAGLLTVGARDSRVTRTGYRLRKYKLDELPQLLNVLAGDMSLVGPRPEVRKFVSMYSPEQRKVLTVKPGITDIASIEYRDENELLAKAMNPDELYIHEIMPHKISLNMHYIDHPTLGNYFRIIFKTVIKLIS